MPRFVSPEPLLDVFTCPHCDVTAAQHWRGNRSARSLWPQFGSDGNYDVVTGDGNVPRYDSQYSEWAFAQCASCGKMSVWHGSRMVYPETCPVEAPNGDMPEEVLEVYKEAAKIAADSPRAAAALLRLGLQLLLEQVLGEESTGGIYGDIKLLQNKNISEYLIRALDIVRISGNESVHPGTVKLNDSPEDAYYLFEILNMVCDNLITQPRRMKEAYNKLPESKRILKVDPLN